MFTETIALEDKVSAPALAAAKQMTVLDSAIKQTESALTLAAASGNVKKYSALSKDLSGYKAALDQIPPAIKEEIRSAQSLAKAEDEMIAKVKEKEAAQAAAMASTKRMLAEQASAFAAYQKQQANAFAEEQKMIGKQNAMKQKEDQNTHKQAEADKAAAMQVAQQQQSKILADGAHAMQVGKETVQAAVSGMKNAFMSLASGDIKGAIAGVTESFAGMAKMLDLVVPGLGQAASMLITIAGGLAGMAVGIAKSGMAMALEASQAKTEMLAYFDAMGQGIVTGAQTEEMIDGLKAKIGIAKDSLVGWTKELQAMGMVDLGEIEKNLTAIASASALAGKTGEAAFLKLTSKIQALAMTGGKLKLADKQIAALAQTGANVVDVADQMGMSAEKLREGLSKGTIDAAKFGDALQNALIKKGAGPLEKMAASLPNLKKMLSESIGDMFEDIDVGPFLAQIKSLFDIFGQAKPSGQALKTGIQGAFQKIFDMATIVVPYIKHFLLDLVILGLKAYIGLKPVIKWVNEMAQKQPVINAFWMTVKGLGSAFAMIVAPVILVIGIVTALGAAFMFVMGMTAAVVGSIMNFGVQIFGTLGGYAKQAVTWGTDFVNGIIEGITGGASALVSSVTDLANTAQNTFKSVMGINSPARAMIGPGANVSYGVAEGIDDGAPAVTDASANLAKASANGFSDAAPAAASAPAAGGGGGGGNVITATINVIGGAANSIMELTEQAVILLMERIAMQKGVGA